MRNNKPATIEAIQKAPLDTLLRPGDVAALVYDPMEQIYRYESLRDSLNKKIRRSGIPADDPKIGNGAWYGRTWQLTIPEKYRKITPDHQPDKAGEVVQVPTRLDLISNPSMRKMARDTMEMRDEKALTERILNFMIRNHTLTLRRDGNDWIIDSKMETPLWGERLSMLPVDFKYYQSPGVSGLFQLIWDYREVAPDKSDANTCVISPYQWWLLTAVQQVMWQDYDHLPALVDALLEFPKTTLEQAGVARFILACALFDYDESYFSHEDGYLLAQQRVQEATTALEQIKKIRPTFLPRCEAEILRMRTLIATYKSGDPMVRLKDLLGEMKARSDFQSLINDSVTFSYYVILLAEVVNPYDVIKPQNNLHICLRNWSEDPEQLFFYYGVSMRQAAREGDGATLYHLLHDPDFADFRNNEPFQSYYKFCTATVLRVLGLTPDDGDELYQFWTEDAVGDWPFESTLLRILEERHRPDLQTPPA